MDYFSEELTPILPYLFNYVLYLFFISNIIFDKIGKYYVRKRYKYQIVLMKINDVICGPSYYVYYVILYAYYVILVYYALFNVPVIILIWKLGLALLMNIVNA